MCELIKVYKTRAVSLTVMCYRWLDVPWISMNMSSTVRFAILPDADESGVEGIVSLGSSSNKLWNASRIVIPLEAWKFRSEYGCSRAKRDSAQGKSHSTSIWDRRQG